MQQFSAKIFSNSKISSCFNEIVFSWEPDTTPLPGQFITIRATNGTSPLLRRPFAVSGFDKSQKRCSVIYQKRGPATNLLSEKFSGQKLDIVGPLGNSFPQTQTKQSILVAGGTGVGPILFLCSELKKANRSFTAVFGARTAELIPNNQFFKDNFVICTDDGTCGFRGTTTDYLKTISENIANAAIFACGPKPMLKSCHEFALSNNIGCNVCVEQIMACGVGACMGCAVKIVKEPFFARACKEGPVFNSTEIDWN